MKETYSVWKVLFFAADTLIQSGLSKEDAKKVKKKYNNVNEDRAYSWYIIKPDL